MRQIIFKNVVGKTALEKILSFFPRSPFADIYIDIEELGDKKYKVMSQVYEDQVAIATVKKNGDVVFDFAETWSGSQIANAFLSRCVRIKIDAKENPRLKMSWPP